MKGILKILYGVLGASVFVALVAFEHLSEEKIRITDIDIMLEQPKNQLFLSKEDILQVITNEDDSLFYRPLSAINSTMLEEKLEKQPFIAEAEVFSTLDGLLSVRVKQKEAVARVIQTSRQHYIDAEGRPFPTTQGYSAFVPILTGATDSIKVHNAFATLTTFNSRPYFENYVAEIHCNTNGTLAIVPLKGRHRVILGTPADLENKLIKLEAFYRTVVTPKNLPTWKTLNVAYKDQLVSTKHN